MCRNIQTLYNFEPEATSDEVRDAALQYVRKISGFTKPSRANEEAFARAVDAVADASHPRHPFIDLRSGYVLRSLEQLPKQGDRPPWRMYQNYPRDIRMMRHGPLEDEAIAFSRARTVAPSAEAVPA